MPTASITEVVESAGEASALDATHPYTSSAIYTGTDWNTDTGATRHMTSHRHWFKDYKPCRVAIRLADHKIIHSTGCGSVIFRPIINGKPQRLLEFHNVLHVPLLRSILISVLYLVRNQRYDVTIYKSPPICIRFWRDNQLLFIAPVTLNNAAFLQGTVVRLLPPQVTGGVVEPSGGRITALLHNQHGKAVENVSIILQELSCDVVRPVRHSSSSQTQPQDRGKAREPPAGGWCSSALHNHVNITSTCPLD